MHTRRPHLTRKESSKGVRHYTLSEIATHDRNDDLWMIIHDKVYDVTSMIDEHPGGAEVLFECAGMDATEPFDDVGHSQDSVNMLKPLFVGLVKQDKIDIDVSDDEDVDEYNKKSQNLSLGESLYLKNYNKNKRRRKQLTDKYFTHLLMLIALIAGSLYIYIERRKWKDEYI